MGKQVDIHGPGVSYVEGMDGYTKIVRCGSEIPPRKIDTKYRCAMKHNKSLYNEVRSINKNGVSRGTHQKCNELKHEITRLFMKLLLQLRTVW